MLRLVTVPLLFTLDFPLALTVVLLLKRITVLLLLNLLRAITIPSFLFQKVVSHVDLPWE